MFPNFNKNDREYPDFCLYSIIISSFYILFLLITIFDVWNTLQILIFSLYLAYALVLVQALVIDLKSGCRIIVIHDKKIIFNTKLKC